MDGKERNSAQVSLRRIKPDQQATLCFRILICKQGWAIQIRAAHLPARGSLWSTDCHKSVIRISAISRKARPTHPKPDLRGFCSLAHAHRPLTGAPPAGVPCRFCWLKCCQVPFGVASKFLRFGIFRGRFPTTVCKTVAGTEAPMKHLWRSIVHLRNCPSESLVAIC